MTAEPDSARLIRTILKGYALPVRGMHGVLHWARVLENGIRLAGETGADLEVVSLFALFHDSRRVSDGNDPGHGRRGAEFASSIRHELGLDEMRFDLLYEACRLHTDGHTRADVTIQTCWDADRLDLGRVGVRPRPERLCTDAARALIPWAHARAIEDVEPTIVQGVWRLGAEE